ncbi:hypothetical protein ASF61_08860 [Duganella sp. Leaf126]|uniref:ATP-binding protein n=1 Tax=Duganella sp. Leaf126 TaxID=1736266 RepID=UPI0006F63325|nr:ATP-binding protein [Duganella sp. Leaf126]KQQ36278.1 hypothetical protein ASF61_08860 [Duganella sp. Leaf126]
MNTSLQYRLSASIALAVVLMAGTAALFTLIASWNDAHIAQDKQLRQIAHLIGRLQTGPVTLAARQKISGITLDERIVVRFLNPTPGEPEAYDGLPVFATPLLDGLQTVELDQDSWRVFVRTDGNGVRLAVAQQTRVRNAVAINNAVRALIPFALLAALLPLLVHWLIRKLFGPLRVLAAEAGARAHDDLRQLDAAGLPDEVQPLVAEINRLLTRVNAAMQAQRRFVADAAHELRSPLTAMSLQTERLAAADMPDEARRRMQTLAAGLQRTRAMLDQLLALARSQQGAPEAAGAAGAGAAAAMAVSLQQVVRAVIEDLYPLAEQRAIDLGVLSGDDALVAAPPLALTMLVKNLVDNALRYTPPGGRVDVSFRSHDGGVELIVDDSGPGIPQPERERVFDAFYRILDGSENTGSGLGLAIVKAVADKAGAAVRFDQAPLSATGLRVIVAFPAVAGARPPA